MTDFISDLSVARSVPANPSREDSASAVRNLCGDQSAQQGFTLLEVMIALAILAIASAGLLIASSGFVRQSSLMEQKVIAGWAADNWLTELRLASSPPSIGESRAEATLAGHRFLLKAQTQATESPHLVRVEIRVFDAEALSADASDYALANLTSFLSVGG